MTQATKEILEQSQLQFSQKVKGLCDGGGKQAGGGAAAGANDGKIDRSEWREFCRAEPQLVDWIRNLGQYWLRLVTGVGLAAGSQSSRQLTAAERDHRRSASRTLLDAAALKGFLSGKLHRVPLGSLIAAVRSAPNTVNREGCAHLVELMGA